ncbi:hypothetical protein [Roseateles sp. MS654]|uniref:hypothetical protein n=1 Tax=Roseateles sp. MS654 TaxID=3412685 RepID=UPI003C306D0A
MHPPLLDTRNFRPLRLACNMVTYAHHFFLKDRNRALAEALTDGDAGVRGLIDALHAAQVELEPHLPLAGIQEVWKARESFLGRAGIKTLVPGEEGVAEVGLIETALDLQLLETVVSKFPTEVAGSAPNAEVVRLACQCVWLSEVLALVVIGVASVSKTGDGSWAVQPATEAHRVHLRRLAFGSAFERSSLNAASAAVQILADVASDPAKRSQLTDARMSALTVFPQHWRLPAHFGPAEQLLFEWLEPLLLMMIYCIAASQRAGAPPFGPREAAAKQITEVYEFVRGVQASMPFIDRLFEVTSRGLVLGTRDLAPAAIEMAERIAAHRLGADWHGNATSDTQKTYLLDRIKSCEHVEVLEFELRQHHTTRNVGLDVDFFVRDTEHGQIYGVQLKHLQRQATGGLLAWLAQFRENDDSLGNLVRQLENLTDVARTDGKARAHLFAHGLSPTECDQIIPVGVHNVGFVDFWEVQNGVLLYDLHTFANILTDRPGVAVGMAYGRVVNESIDKTGAPRPSLHSPDSVIASCLRRPSLQHLRSFDLVSRLRRQSSVAGTLIVADGLGV